MMNVLALGLVLTSLVTAGFFTPSPEKQKLEEDVIVKEGHRVVVVEYEKDDGNTKVLISPQDSHKVDEKGIASNVYDKMSEKMENVKEEGKRFASNVYDKMSERMENVKEGVREVSSSVLPDVGKISEAVVEKVSEAASEAVGKVKECKHRIATAMGKMSEAAIEATGKVKECKHRIATAMGKMSEPVVEKVSEAASEAAGKVKECKHRIATAMGKMSEPVVEKVSEAASEAAGKVKECKHRIATAMGKMSEAVVEKVSEAASEAAGKVKDTVSHTAQKPADKVQEAQDNVNESASGIKEEASKKMEGAKENMKESASEIKEEASRRTEEAKEMAKEATETAKKVKREGQKELSEIMHHAREVAVDVFHYVVSAERVAPVTGVMHLMGFAAAYGMCVWVTFASSQVLAGALPRQQFGIVQSKVYPAYFRAMGYSVGLALLGHLMSPKGSHGGRSEGWFQGFNLMAALGMVLTNLLYVVVEPRATKVMLERMKEKEEGSKLGHATEPIGGSTTQEAAAKSEIIRLSEALQRLNSYSSFLNVTTLVSLTWHLVRLGSHLHTQC